jgi:acyl-CoA thioester hydrolase
MSHPTRRLTATTEIRVIFGDTDQMGIVYYANYLRWFEASRGAFLRDAGRPYSELERAGWGMPVIEAHVKYVRPARYDDLIHVTVAVDEVKRASLRFRYEVRRGHELLADGWTIHACVDRGGRAVRIPEEIRALLE